VVFFHQSVHSVFCYNCLFYAANWWSLSVNGTLK